MSDRSKFLIKLLEVLSKPLLSVLIDYIKLKDRSQILTFTLFTMFAPDFSSNLCASLIQYIVIVLCPINIATLYHVSETENSQVAQAVDDGGDKQIFLYLISDGKQNPSHYLCDRNSAAGQVR